MHPDIKAGGGDAGDTTLSPTFSPTTMVSPRSSSSPGGRRLAALAAMALAALAGCSCAAASVVTPAGVPANSLQQPPTTPGAPVVLERAVGRPPGGFIPMTTPPAAPAAPAVLTAPSAPAATATGRQVLH